jgi:hypothetical protein
LEALLPARGQKCKRRPQIYGWKLKKECDFFSVKVTSMLLCNMISNCGHHMTRGGGNVVECATLYQKVANKRKRKRKEIHQFPSGRAITCFFFASRSM